MTALVTRTLSNTSVGLSHPDGNPMVGVLMSFVLIDKNGIPSSVFDDISGQRVSNLITTTTDSLGEFSINIWPNDRGDIPTRYICKCYGLPDFISRVPSGDTPLTWAEFAALRTIP